MEKNHIEPTNGGLEDDFPINWVTFLGSIVIFQGFRGVDVEEKTRWISVTDPPPIENTQQNTTVSKIGVKNDVSLPNDTSPLLLVVGPCFCLLNSPLFQVNSLPST